MFLSTFLAPIALSELCLAPWWLLFLIVIFLGFFCGLCQWPGRKVKVIPTRASKFSPSLVPDKLDTIVIGSGSGGCACANLLAQSGQRVLLLEQHEDRTGGCTHTFRLEGCEWDTGLHYTSEGMSNPTHRAGALLNFMTRGKQEWQRLDDPYDQIIFPEDQCVMPGRPNYSNYEFNTGSDNVINSLMERVDPKNKDLLEKCKTWMELCGVVNHGFTALGMSRIVPSMFHFLLRKKIKELYKLTTMTVQDVQYAVFNQGYSVQDLLQKDCPKAPEGTEPDPVLRRVKGVLNHPIGDYAVQPREATYAAQGITMAHYMEGAAYTVGPTQNISIRSSSMLRNMGGEVLCDATVEDIILENGRAVGVHVRNTSDVSGKVVEIRARNVVCATSVFNLYHKLLPRDTPAVQDFMDPAKRSIRQSNGHIFLFCKIKGDAKDLQLPTHNLWYFNSYDVDQAFDKYFADPVGERPPTVYIGFPCTKDPTWPKRLPGISNCILISDGLWEWFAKWSSCPVHQRGDEYEAFKDKLAKHLLDILYETVPQVKDKVEYWTLGTPLSEATYLSSFCGGSYGTRCDTNIFAPLNHKWTTTPHTPIPGLYMAGSDAFLPAVCGAMYGGCLAASAILGYIGSLRMVVAFLSEFATAFQTENPKMSRPAAYLRAVKVFCTEPVAN